MAVYAIGDIQGCFDELQRLLEKVAFDPRRDRLWFTGDLVNRGPKSLEVLRFVKGLGEAAITVLGNHDLHLLAVWRHRQRYVKASDTLEQVLAAPDRDELLEWLRRRPLLHHDAARNYALVHAGLPPEWDLPLAQACAREVEEVLQGSQFEAFLERMYGDEPRRWSEELSGWERMRFNVNCFTRLRFCMPDGSLEFKEKGKPGDQRPPLLPWFALPGRRSRNVRIVFGHWSTLGLHLQDGVCGLDTGCLWGGSLTALRLEDAVPVQLPCPGAQTPGTE